MVGHTKQYLGCQQCKCKPIFLPLGRLLHKHKVAHTQSGSPTHSMKSVGDSDQLTPTWRYSVVRPIPSIHLTRCYIHLIFLPLDRIFLSLGRIFLFFWAKFFFFWAEFVFLWAEFFFFWTEFFSLWADQEQIRMRRCVSCLLLLLLVLLLLLFLLLLLLLLLLQYNSLICFFCQTESCS